MFCLKAEWGQKYERILVPPKIFAMKFIIHDVPVVMLLVHFILGLVLYCMI